MRMESHGPPVDHGQSQMSGVEKMPSGWYKPTHSRSSSTASSRHSRLNVKHWEVMEDVPVDRNLPGENLQDSDPPGTCEGYLMKRRKWPLKGWHKRYFVLEKGILRYSKNHYDQFFKGKTHGSLDVSLAVMSVNRKARRIDLDAGDNLYHMKAKSQDLYYIWLTKLSAHRMYKKNEAAHVQNDFLQAGSQSDHVSHTTLQDMSMSTPVSNQADTHRADLPCVNPAVNGKVSAWLQQTQEPDICSQELNRCQLELSELYHLVQKLQSLESGQAGNNEDLQTIISMQNLSLEKPKKKTAKIWSLSRVEALGMFSSSHLNSSAHLETSVPSIPDYVFTPLTPADLTSPESMKLHQDICCVSLKVHASLRSTLEVLTQERQRLQDVWSSRELQQNICAHSSNLCGLAEFGSERSSVHVPSVADSAAEYFDACDELVCVSSSEVSDESGLSDGSSNSEPDEARALASRKYRASLSKAPPKVNTIESSSRRTSRRTSLPAVCPDNSHVGLMSILYNNIGKDLSCISMPAALNEPVNLLQRLCEELEYSELLDTANHTDDPYQRMVYVAAFAISGYTTAQYRNRYKPFNPVLGETFECVREDRGFRYISEQVSHHPPISACHAESDSFSFWQDQRWKNKFWGKSLEIMPAGMVNVTLKKYGDHYEWNKVVTCVHNVLSQQRYLEHYGEVIIHNLKSAVCTCRITFVKSHYWGSDGSKNQVQGEVLDVRGTVVHRFGGFWHEGIFCDTLPNPQCVWKPNPQPKNYLRYYGLSSFAMEMNELTPDLKPLLPPTDTRLRPDQRLLEEGKVDECDTKKDEVEEKQRQRRKILAKKGEDHVPRFFRKTLDAAGREVWLYNGSYWKIRENPGFSNMRNLELW